MESRHTGITLDGLGDPSWSSGPRCLSFLSTGIVQVFAFDAREIKQLLTGLTFGQQESLPEHPRCQTKWLAVVSHGVQPFCLTCVCVCVCACLTIFRVFARKAKQPWVCVQLGDFNNWLLLPSRVSRLANLNRANRRVRVPGAFLRPGHDVGASHRRSPLRDG